MTITRNQFRSSVLLFLTVFGIAACGGDSTAEGTDTASGSLVGGTPPSTGKVVVIWSVSSGSPDYAYKFGEGTSTGAEYVVSVGEGPPPKEAINSYGIGIGILALVDANLALPDGKIDEDTLDSVLGLSQKHAIIWRADDAQDLDWSGAFPRGFSCGRCVEAPEGEGFDSFTPVECTGLEIQLGVDGGVCNWT